MSIIQNVLSPILPAVVTGLITFFITRYSYRNQTTIDKIEIAYDKFYYPVFQYIFKHPNLEEFDELINLCEKLMQENEKYISDKTIEFYYSFKKASEGSNKENIRRCYETFERNIKQANNRLRYRIGYYQPNIMDHYFTWGEAKQLGFWLIVLIIIVDILIKIYSVCSPEGGMRSIIGMMILTGTSVSVIFIVALGVIRIIVLCRKIKNRK